MAESLRQLVGVVGVVAVCIVGKLSVLGWSVRPSVWSQPSLISTVPATP